MEIPRTKCPTVFVHGNRDVIVPVQHSEQLLEASGASSKEFVRFPEADHDNIFEEEYLEAAIEAMKRILPLKENASPREIHVTSGQQFDEPGVSQRIWVDLSEEEEMLLTSTMKSLIQSLETEGERMVQAEQQQQVSGSDHIHYRPGTSVTMRSHNPEFDGMVATVVRLVDEEQKVYELHASNGSDVCKIENELVLSPGTIVVMRSKNPVFDGMEATVVDFIDEARGYRLQAANGMDVIKEGEDLVRSWVNEAQQIFEKLETLFSTADVDGNGLLNKEEFIHLMNAYHDQQGHEIVAADVELEVEEALECWDINSSGFLSLEELIQMFCNSASFSLPLPAELKHELATRFLEPGKDLSLNNNIPI